MSTDVAPRWRRLEPDQRRDEILGAAIRLFGERPYASVSTKELADAAGVTRGLLHHYFGTKRELYLEVVRTMMFVPPLEQAVELTGSLRERVELAIDWALSIIAAHGRSWVVISGSEGIGPDPEVQRLLDEADDLAAQRLLEAVGFEGTDSQHETALAAIRCFGGMVKAASREWVGRKSVDRAELQAILTEALLAVMAVAVPTAKP